MKPIICFGEALIDMISHAQIKIDGLTLPQFTQYPGGAPANAAVAAAKLGGNSYFVGQVGSDPFGHAIIQALNHYGVNSQWVYQSPSAPTAVAIVSHDATGERSFSFYRNKTADVMFDASKLNAADLTTVLAQQGIFHFCSNTLTDPHIAKVTQQAVLLAAKHHNLISFDVNLRHHLWPQLQADIEPINQLVKQAHLVKFSREEFEYLSQAPATEYLKQLFSANCRLVVITDGSQPIEYYLSPNIKKVVQAPQVKVVDTTAGGDGFIGGLLYGLSQITQTLDKLAPQQLNALIKTAAQCGAITVTRLGAFAALPSNDDLKQFQGSNIQ